MTQEASRRQSSRQKLFSPRCTTRVVLGFSSRRLARSAGGSRRLVRHTRRRRARGRLNEAWAYASPQVQSALPAKRDGPRAPQIRPRKSKLIQINPRKIAWISLDFFGGIGAFQWVTANPNKKILLLSHCIPDVTKAGSSGGARVSISHDHLSTINEHFGPPRSAGLCNI
jgi:hypothetical protein